MGQLIKIINFLLQLAPILGLLFFLFSCPHRSNAQAEAKPPLPTQPPEAAAFSWGSQVVLEACWSEAERRGTPAEKKTVPRRRNSLAGLPPAAIGPNLALPPLPPDLQGSIRAATPADGRKLMALTFDLCEGKGEISGYDVDIVAFLRETGLKATFFAGGQWLASHPQRAMQLMADPLLEIGNHSWSHPNFRLISAATMREQISRTQAEYALLREKLVAKALALDLPAGEIDKIPRLPRLFRFPYGVCSEQALEITAGFGLPAIQWSIVTADSVKSQSAEKIARGILEKARPGAIVIMHANGRGHQTAKALPLCTLPLRDQGYEFVTVSELLYSGPVVASPTCYEERPGDSRRYDPIPEGQGQSE